LSHQGLQTPRFIPTNCCLAGIETLYGKICGMGSSNSNVEWALNFINVLKSEANCFWAIYYVGGCM